MAYSEYWNPKNETMPREELQKLQLLKLQRYVSGHMLPILFTSANLMPRASNQSRSSRWMTCGASPL